VSFEHDTAPVRTYRGEIAVANPRLGARRAIEAAQRAYPGARWRSVVVVLEKLGADAEADAAAPAAEVVVGD
jgi:hypothetical protein